MRLYRVEVVVEMLVVAETRDAAEELALAHAGDEASQNPDNAEVNFAEELGLRHQVPRDWIGSRPYGAPDDRPCEAWVTP